MKWVGVVVLMIASFSASAQYSIGGGVSTLFSFGNQKPYAGLHLAVEFPRNNEVTFFVRANYLFKQNSVQGASISGQFPDFTYAYNKDPLGSPAFVEVPINFTESMNFFMIDGGTRYYLINGFDEGFSVYGGTNIGLVINSLKYKYSVGEYDRTNFEILEGESTYDSREQGTIINIAAGLTGGVKYTMPGRGTLYFDFNPSLMLFGLPSKDGLVSSLYKQVVFNFNIGYRREFY